MHIDVMRYGVVTVLALTLTVLHRDAEYSGFFANIQLLTLY